MGSPDSHFKSDFVRNFRPRVERNVPMSIYLRAINNPRPGSIAWASADMNSGSVSISRTLSNSMSGSNFTSSVMGKTNPYTAYTRPVTHIPVGEKRNVFEVRRVGDDHFTFSQRAGATLDPGPGVIRDRDTVENVTRKLQQLFPDPMPQTVSMGDAVLPGQSPSRPVRTVIAAKGKCLADADPIGHQCLKMGFKKYFHPKTYFQDRPEFYS